MPYLFIAGMLDIICLPQVVERARGMGLTPNLTVEEVDAGHWCLFAKPKEVGDFFVELLGNNF
jgi:soluble epoxide hydrolase / lipid-phosphate phosphatase